MYEAFIYFNAHPSRNNAFLRILVYIIMCIYEPTFNDICFLRIQTLDNIRDLVRFCQQVHYIDFNLCAYLWLLRRKWILIHINILVSNFVSSRLFLDTHNLMLCDIIGLILHNSTTCFLYWGKSNIYYIITI